MSLSKSVAPALFAVFLLNLGLFGCGGGNEASTSAPVPPVVSTYTIGGTITGLAGTGLVLRNNATDNLNVAGVSFTFGAPLTTGTAYSVTVVTQPSNPVQTCTVGNGSGIVANASITNVLITCQTMSAIAPRAAYMLNLDPSVAAMISYGVNTQTGALTEIARAAMPEIDDRGRVTLDPLGRFVYVDTEEEVLRVFKIDTVTGALTQSGFYDNGSYPGRLALHPQGQFAYGILDGSIQPYAVDARTGQVTASSAAVSVGNANLSAITIDPSGRFAFALRSGVNTNNALVFRIDASTGSLTRVLPDILTASGDPRAVAVHPSGRFAYLANSGTVAAYSVDASSGALTSIAAPTLSGLNVQAVSIDPAGRFLYALNAGNASVSASVRLFRIDASTGALTIALPDTETQPGSQDSKVDPSGQFLYVVGMGEARAYRIDAASGVLTTPTTTRVDNGFLLSIAITAGSPVQSYLPKFVYATNLHSDNVSGYVINAASGALTSVGAAVATGNEPTSIAVMPSGQYAYVANRLSDTIQRFSINATTGVLTSLGTTASLGEPVMVRMHPSGRFLFVVNSDANTLGKFAIDVNTGALNPIGAPVATGLDPRDVAFDPTGELAYVANVGSNNISAYRINLSSGALTSLGNTPGQIVHPLAALTRLAVDPSGRYLVASYGYYIGAYRIDLATGVLTDTGSLGGDASRPITAIAFHPNGQFIYEARVNEPLTPNNGFIHTRLMESPFGLLDDYDSFQGTILNASDVVVSRSGRFAYVADSDVAGIPTGVSGVRALRIDPSTGGMAAVGTIVPAGDYPSAVVIAEVLQ